METIAPKPLGPVWKDRLSLSTRREPEFYERSGDIGNLPHGALHTALDDLGGSAVVLSADDPFRRGGGAG